MLGGLCVCYVNLTFNLALHTQRHFEVAALIVISVAAVGTVLMALWETRDLRRVLASLAAGESIPLAAAIAAGRQAVLFPGRHALNEAIVDPFLTILPLCMVLYLADNAPVQVMVQVGIAGFMGLAAIIMTTYFISERWLRPVIQRLLDKGIPIAYGNLPESKLQFKMMFCFGLTTAVTGLMIGALANQRATDIINDPERQAEAVSNLRRHTFFIMLRVASGCCFRGCSRTRFPSACTDGHGHEKRAERQFDERVHPTGNDEIDVLARQFNAMVEQLDKTTRRSAI